MRVVPRRNITLIILVTALIVVEAVPERRRPVKRPATTSFDCNPAELPAPQAAQCRDARHAEGRRLFDLERFGGNGRTCQTCHSPETGTFSAADAAARLATNPLDPLFLHDGLDDGLSGTAEILRNATVRVTLPLPVHLRLVDDPSATHLTVRRGTPTTLNTPALDERLMSDLRDPTLVAQAMGAIRSHAQPNVEPTPLQLELIAEFQKNDDRFFSSNMLREFARSGVPPLLPLGTTESEKRGRRAFEDQSSRFDPVIGICALCHSGPMLNEANQFALQLLGLPRGVRISSAHVSERNLLGSPVLRFEVRDRGSVTIVASPDPGVLLSAPTSPGVAAELAKFGANYPLRLVANMFKTPSLWGVKHTAPYFHDNSAKDFDELLGHYNAFFESQGLGPNALNPQDIEDIKAFMNLL